MGDYGIVQGKAGPTPLADGGNAALRMGKGAELIVAQCHGKYTEACCRGMIYGFSSQAATATSIALATAYTGLCLINPAGSPVNIALLQVGALLTTAQVAVSSIGLIGNYSGTAVTNTTPGTAYSAFLGRSAGYGKISVSATLPATPIWLQQYGGSFTAGALGSHTPHIIEVDGSIVLPPSSYVAIGSLTALSGFFSMMWEEVQI